MAARGQAGYRAALIDELVSLKAGAGATYANVREKAKLLHGIDSVRRQVEELPDEEAHIGVRKALVCAVDKHIAFSRHKLVLMYGLNFAGAGEGLDARRIELEQLFGISMSTIKRDEPIACAELADVLLSLSESPCAVKTRPDPVDPALLRSLVEGLVDNKLSALLRGGGAQTAPIQAQAVFDGIRATRKISMGISLIEKLAASQGRSVSGMDVVAELLAYAQDYPNARIDRSPVFGLAASDLGWVQRYLRIDGFASTKEAALSAQESVLDRNIGIIGPNDERPTLYYPQFVRNTFNLVAFHLIQEESEGWSALKAALGTARQESPQATVTDDVQPIRDGAS